MSTNGKLVMGTRGSALALVQSRMVAQQLQAVHLGLIVEERIIRTTGDRQQSVSLPSIGGKGVFTLEIEQALLSGEINFAVHSLKDLPPELPAGLALAVIPKREAANDVCIAFGARSSDAEHLPYLLPGARVGTSSLRRAAQLLWLRADLKVENLRGNIDTRLRKLQDEDWDAILLAQAGINRLEAAKNGSFQLHPLDERNFVPAPGQGALAIESRTDDETTNSLLAALECDATRAEVTAERAAMRALNAGCSTPLGARAVANGQAVEMWAAVLSPDGKERIFAEAAGAVTDAEAIGRRVAQQLLEQGAADLIEKP